jgi:hypothetical protein
MLRIEKVNTKSGSSKIQVMQYDRRLPRSSNPRRPGFPFSWVGGREIPVKF